MKKYFYLKILILSLFLISTSVFSQVNSSDKIKMNVAANEAETKAANRPWYEKKINSVLLDKIEKMIQEDAKSKYSGKIMSEKYSDPVVNVDETGMIKLKVELFDTSSRDDFNDVIDQLKKIGGKIHQSYYPQADIKWYPEIHCYIMYDEIKEIAKDKRIANINISDRYVIRTGTVTTEGDIQLSAQLARTQHGVNGNGIKVGVISVGVQSYDNSRSNGDLPVVEFVTSNTYPDDEGTAMMEIVYDLAEGASLAFGDVQEYGTSAGMQVIISDLVNTNCKIVVDDIGWFTDPWFSDGALAQHIYSKIQYNNISYISAAGNDGVSMWGGNFNGDFDNWHIFYHQGQTGYIQNGFELPDGETVQIDFQWADEWDDAINNYDLYLYSPANGSFVGSGGKIVQGDGNNQHPHETLIYTNNLGYQTWFYVQLKRVSGESRELKVSVNPYEFEYTKPNSSSITSNQVYGHPATLGVISVAAYPAQNQTILEDYSSRGPTKIWTYPGGTFETRITPTITATDNCSTSVAGFNPFPGTSASAPHIAGIAALYYEKYGTSTNQQNFYNDLKNNADGIAGGTGGTWNNQSGYGKANAFEALGGGPLNVTVNQINSSLSPVGSIDHWENNNWVNYSNLPHTFQWDENSQHVLKATQSVINNEKYHDWFNDPDETYINHENFTITQTVNEITANLDHTKNATIKTELTAGGSGGNVEFKDPWFEDFNEAPYGYRNRGTNPIWHSQSSPLNLTLASNYKGVFLHQELYDPTYYSVRAPEFQEIDGIESFFLNWEASGADLQSPNNLTTAVVFRQENAEVKANYKGHLYTENSTSYDFNSQRKLVRTNNGKYHTLYRDYNSLWYTKSKTTDFNDEWEKEERYLEDDENYYKVVHPSLDYFGDNLAITYVQDWFNGAGYRVCLDLYNPANGSKDTWVVDQIDELSSRYPKPVVAYTRKNIMVIWYNHVESKLMYRILYNNGSSWNWLDVPQPVPNTDSNSKNPTMAGFKTDSDVYTDIHIAWQRGTSQVKYIKYYWKGSIREFRVYQTASSGSGFILNRYPSISLFNGNSPILSWTGSWQDNEEEKSLPKPASYIKWIHRAVVRPLSRDFYTTGFNVNYTNNNSGSVYNNTIITYSYNNGNACRYIKRNEESGEESYFVEELSESGLQTQVSNGDNFSQIKAMVFDNSGDSPYPLLRSSTNFGSAAKPADVFNISYGRKGVVVKNEVEFVFYSGDILLDGDAIEFINRQDTIGVNTLAELNEAMVTEPFTLSSNSELLFSNFYYVLNMDSTDTLLTADDSVHFKLELLKESTNEVIATFDDIIYTLQNLEKYENMDYMINCSGIETGSYYFRLITEVQGQAASYFLSNIHNDQNTLAKRTYSEVDLSSHMQPLTYNLKQNYPNPFNPVTKIYFQIPEPGKVNLTVYDIQGRVVTTLVNGQMEEGRYSIPFNGSNLSSGIYFYEMVIGDYREVRKMMLVK